MIMTALPHDEQQQQQRDGRCPPKDEHRALPRLRKMISPPRALSAG
jgi:hypothetical protein